MSPARAAKRDAQQVAYFDTAWGPPIPVIVALSDQFPDAILRITYDEPSCGFCGFVTLQAGDVIAGKHRD